MNAKQKIRKLRRLAKINEMKDKDRKARKRRFLSDEPYSHGKQKYTCTY
jgi:hypothetical protein